MKLPQDVQDRLRKLRALAERGIGGEKRAAQAQYERILAEFGLTDQDVCPQERRYETYTIRNQHEEKLLFQVWAKVTRSTGSISYRQEGSQRRWLMATDAEHAQIKAEYARHRKALAEHLARATVAYCLAHELTGPPVDAPTDMSAEDIARMRRAIQAVELTDAPRPALGAGRPALGGD